MGKKSSGLIHGQQWDSAEDFIRDAFAKGARKPSEAVHGGFLVLVPTVVLVKDKGAKVSKAVWASICNGTFLALTAKTTRKDFEKLELEDELDYCGEHLEAILALDLDAPA